MRTSSILSALLFAAAPAALAQDTFHETSVARAEAFWRANATGGDSMDCITTLNHAVRVLYANPNLQLSSQIDRTMEALRGVGLAHARRDVEFLNPEGKPTTGVTQPDKLRESLYSVLVGLTGSDRGFSVFGLSLMDGYHSVALVFDNRDPAAPKIFWADQWSSNGGYREHTGASLDAEIERLTRNWWSSTKKPRTRATLWRLKPGDGKNALEVRLRSGIPSLNLRSGPGTSFEQVGTARPADRFEFLDFTSQWLKLRTASGQIVYAHRTYLVTQRVQPTASTTVAASSPSSGVTTVLGGLGDQ